MGITSLLALASGALGLAAVRSGGKDRIPGSYIVVLKEDVDFQGLRNFGLAHGAHYTYPAIRGFAADLNEFELDRVRNADIVDFVQENVVAEIFYETQRNPTWGLDRIDQQQLPLDNEYKFNERAGAGVNAYVVDTGIWTTHEEFEDRVKEGYNFVKNQVDAMDDNGHGTHCAGTVAGKTLGVAKEANLIPVKVMGRFGFGGLDNIIAGYQYVIDSHKPGDKSVVNLSLGSARNEVIQRMTQKAIAAGIVLVAASGNSNADACTFSPAAAGGINGDVITVNAIDFNDQRSEFSNYGECTDIFAPGSDITSAWIGDDSARQTISGTSMACPHVAGAAAVYMSQFPDVLSPAQVKTALLKMATEDTVTDAMGSPNLSLFSAYQ